MNLRIIIIMVKCLIEIIQVIMKDSEGSDTDVEKILERCPQYELFGYCLADLSDLLSDLEYEEDGKNNCSEVKS